MTPTLVVDIGGTSIKLSLEGTPERRFASGPWMTPGAMVDRVKRRTEDWQYERISLGYPGVVREGRPAHEPWNLGDGWMAFDFGKAFKCPVKIINDAALQALGNYDGGRMLFLGLGTSLGAALIADNTIMPLELGSLAHPSGETLEERLNSKALRGGRPQWRAAVLDSLPGLLHAFAVDYLTLGGGNSKYVPKLPEACLHGAKNACLIGGGRLWQTHERPSTHQYRP